MKLKNGFQTTTGDPGVLSRPAACPVVMEFKPANVNVMPHVDTMGITPAKARPWKQSLAIGVTVVKVGS